MSYRETITLNHTLARLRIALRSASTYAERCAITAQIDAIAARLAGNQSTAISI